VNFGAMVWSGMASSARAVRMTSNSGGVCGLSVSYSETSEMKLASPLDRVM